MEAKRGSKKRKSFNQDEAISRVTVKDLRSRRVFSPAVVIDSPEVAGKKSFGDCTDLNLVDLVPNLSEIVESCLHNNNNYDQDSSESSPKRSLVLKKDDGIGVLLSEEDPKPSDNGEIEKRDNGCDANPNLCAKEGNGGKGSDSDGAISDQIDDDLVEECVQTTPPDSDVFVEAEVNVNRGISKEHVQGTPSDGGSSCRSRSCVDQTIPASIDQFKCKSKSVVNPCSRLKVFKAPGSVSYRRLLPYLIDIAKDNSFASRNGQYPKLENGLDVKPTVQLCYTQSQEISTDTSTVDISPIEPRNVDCGDLASVIVNPGNPNFISSERITEECSSEVKLDKPSENTSNAKPNVCPKEGNGGKGSDSAGAMVDRIDEDFGEECVQMTPPGPNVLGKAEVHVNGGSSEEHVQGTPLDAGSNCVGKAIPASINKRNNSVYKTKSVLRPCSRLKVFKTPGSVSYRRLLPYLMDLSKDNSFDSRDGQVEKGLEVKPNIQLLDSHSQEISTDRSTVDISPIEPHKVDCGNLPSVVVNPGNPNLISSERITEECSSEVKLVKPSENTSNANPNLCTNEGNDGKGSDSDGAMVDRIDGDFGEEWAQMTLPDPDVLGKAEVNVNGGSSEEHVQEMPLDGESSCVAKAIPASIDRRNNSVYKTKSVLNPCSRLKVFNTPGSVSYRRLLPYLMDISKDNSFASRDGQFPKLEKGLEVKPNLQLLDSHSQEISIDRSTVDISPINPRNVDCGTLPSVVLNSGNPYSTSSESITVKCSSEVKLDKLSNITSNANPDLCTKEGNDGKGSDSDGAMSDRISDDFVEECIQTTPPDFDVFGKAKVTVNGGSSQEHDLGTPLDEGSSCAGKAISINIEQRNNSAYKSKLVWNPCSRLKVLKTPGSVSYRRLLPFLMEMTKDNSVASRNSPSLNFEKGLEVRPTNQRLDSHSQEISVDRSTEDMSPTEPRNVDCGTLSNVILDRVISNSTSSEGITEESLPKVKRVISDKPSELELANDNESRIRGSDPLVMSSCSPDSVEPCQREVYRHSPEDAEEDSKMLGLKFTADGASLDQGLSQFETNISVALPHVVLTKGILKKNPRGCRGLCTCLNCASFRLHAERAFEFSRNQMLDAEELTSELIKELTDLRTMLEKTTDASNDHAVIQVNQVKEACKSVSKAEELAKARLNQMTYDLNNHCKIRCLQRPQVSFANYVEENVDSKADMLSKYSKEMR